MCMCVCNHKQQFNYMFTGPVGTRFVLRRGGGCHRKEWLFPPALEGKLES